MAEISKLKGKKVYFGIQFKRFQSMVICLSCFEPTTASHTIMGECNSGGLFTLWPLGSKESQRREL
jgi:hypothetical protein